MFCFRFDNGYTLCDVWNCRAAVALASYYGRASLARRKQRRLQTFNFSNENAALWVQYLVRESSGNTRKCLQSSLSLLLILTREKRGEGKCVGWWKGGKRLPFPFHPPIVPFSPVPYWVSRDHSLTAYVQNNKRRLRRVSGQIKLEPHPGTVFLIR